MYLETLQEVFSTTDKVIIDEKAGGTGVVPTCRSTSSTGAGQRLPSVQERGNEARYL